MKRCPKCGTVLDDDKKKCYMCGADLLRSSITQFGDSFDAAIGATVSNSQDNVFNNVANIQADLRDAVGKNSDDSNSTFTSSGADFYNNDNNGFSGLDGLNSMQYDNRTAIEKIFSGNQRFKSKDEINAELAKKKNNSEPEMVSNNTNNVNNTKTDLPSFNTGAAVPGGNTNPVPPMNNNGNGMPIPPIQNTGPVPAVNNNNNKKPKIAKPKINWGNNLKKNGSGGGKGFCLDFLKNINVDIGLIVNTACFIVFIIAMLIVYNRVIKPKNDSNLNFGGLIYKVSDDFHLSKEEANSRYYNYGDNCALRITFGTADPNDSISNYFEGVKSLYSSDADYITQESEIDIQGNTWSSLEVLKIEQSAAAIGGTQTSVKFRYITMIYDGSYYRIIFANTADDNKCSAMYKDTINSMKFKK